MKKKLSNRIRSYLSVNTHGYPQNHVKRLSDQHFLKIRNFMHNAKIKFQQFETNEVWYTFIIKENFVEKKTTALL